MTAKVLDGKSLVSRISQRLRKDVERLKRVHHLDIGLGILLVTGDQVSMADAGKISELGKKCGINVEVEMVAQRNVGRRFYPCLEEYAASPFIQGIFIQLPLPLEIIPLSEVMLRLPPEKDIAGMHFINRGMASYPSYEVTSRVHPPEIIAIAETLKEAGVELQGGKVVIVGSNATAGMVKLLAGYLFDKGSNVRLLRYASISSAAIEGRKIKQLDEKLEDTPPDENTLINPDNEAVIAWTNHAGWLGNSRLAPKSIVIDAGYKFSRGRVSGDCDFLPVSHWVSQITPVPGGVRNITHLMILQNLINLIHHQIEEKDDSPGKALKRRFYS